jgi:hypothetical protein
MCNLREPLSESREPGRFLGVLELEVYLERLQ